MSDPIFEETAKEEPAPVRKMLNPHMFEPKFRKWADPRFAGGKMYFPIISRMTRISFKRASEAERYAARVHARWCRLYDAAVLAMVEQ